MAGFDVYSMTGLAPRDAGPVPVGPTQHVAVDAHTVTSVVSPQNPLFWFGLLLATTVGLVGVSGSARIGRAKVSASVGSAGVS